MKSPWVKILLVLLIAISMVAGGMQRGHGAYAATYGDVVISEIMYDPIGAEPDTEWVELYNPGSTSVDISGWVLTDDAAYPAGPITEGYCTIPASTSIPAGGFLVVSQMALTEIGGEVVCTPTGTFDLGDGAGIGTAADELALFTNSGERVFGSLVRPFRDMNAGSNVGDSIGLVYPMAGWSSNTADWAAETTAVGGSNYAHHTAGAANDGWSGYMTTNHAITADGTVSEWQANGEQLGSADGVDFYVTWDANYIYVGMVGGNTASDKYNVLIDTDPLDVGAANSGNAGVDYCGATFADDGKADYAIQLYPGGTAYAQADGSAWNAWTPTDSGGNMGTNQVEFYIMKSDLGLTSSNPVGLYLYVCNNINQVWAAWPPENEANLAASELQTTRVVFENTLSGRSPRYDASIRGTQTLPANTVGEKLFFDDAAGAVDYYARLYVTVAGGASCTVQVTMKGNALATRLDGGLRRSYDINPLGCTGLTATVTLKYNDGTMYGAPDEYRGVNPTSAQLYHWDGAAWVAVTSGYNSTNKVVYTTLPQSSFSTWTAGNAGASAPTAITLHSLEAQHPGFSVWAFLLAGCGLLLVVLTMWRRRKTI
ncbi:MAG: hypothetical protein Fur0018_26510 [Anaerolineales bacterium]